MNIYVVTRDVSVGQANLIGLHNSAMSAVDVCRETPVLDEPLFPNKPDTSFVVVPDGKEEEFINALKEKGMYPTKLSPADVEFLTHIE